MGGYDGTAETLYTAGAYAAILLFNSFTSSCSRFLVFSFMVLLDSACINISDASIALVCTREASFEVAVLCVAAIFAMASRAILDSWSAIFFVLAALAAPAASL